MIVRGACGSELSAMVAGEPAWSKRGRRRRGPGMAPNGCYFPIQPPSACRL